MRRLRWAAAEISGNVRKLEADLELLSLVALAADPEGEKIYDTIARRTEGLTVVIPTDGEA